MEELDLFELDNFEDIYEYCATYLINRTYYSSTLFELLDTLNKYFSFSS